MVFSFLLLPVVAGAVLSSSPTYILPPPLVLFVGMYVMGRRPQRHRTGRTLFLIPKGLRDVVDPGVTAFLHYDQSIRILEPLDPGGAELDSRYANGPAVAVVCSSGCMCLITCSVACAFFSPMSPKSEAVPCVLSRTENRPIFRWGGGFVLQILGVGGL